MRLTWATFKKLGFILKTKRYPQIVKIRFLDQCAFPVFTYGAQLRTLTKDNMDKTAKAHRTMRDKCCIYR